jgi:TRAP-type C4-dicarboxylate transport system substrate-binding protein
MNRASAALAAASTALALALVPAARAADPVLLKFAFPAPPMSYVNTGGVDPWTKQVMADAQGTLDIKLFPGGAIANFGNVYDRVVNGVAELGFGTVGTIANLFQRTSVSTVPFVTQESYESSMAIWRLNAKGVTSQDFETVKILGLFTFASGGLHSTKPILNGDDFKGLKLGTAGKLQADTFALLGAAPITLTPAEMYQALQRGLVVGANLSWAGVQVFKLFEVTHYHLDLPFGAAPGYIIMNKDAYARLPGPAKAAIDKHSGEALSKMTSLAGIADDRRNFARMQTLPNQHFARVEPAEAKRWETLLAPITQEWIRITPDGAKVLEAYKAEVLIARKEPR